MWKWLEKIDTTEGILRFAPNGYSPEYEWIEPTGGFIYYPASATDIWPITGYQAYNKYGLQAINMYDVAETTGVMSSFYGFYGGGGLEFVYTRSGGNISIQTFVLGKRWERLYGSGILSFGNRNIKRLYTASIAYNSATQEAYVFVFYGSQDAVNGSYICSCKPIDMSKNYYDILVGNLPKFDDDPNAGGGFSHPGGGGGDFDADSDQIDLPGLPAFNFVNGSLMTVYVPTPEQLNAFADFLWSDYKGGLNQLAKLFTSPLDCILSLHILPLSAIPKGPVKIVKAGNYSTGIYMPTATEQFVDVDCGSVAISEYWGNYLDYNPYTKIKLILPYIGEVGLDPDEVMGQVISIKYRIDITTGSMIAFVCTETKVLEQYNAICQYNLPLSRQDYSNLHNAHLSMAATAAGLAATVVTGGLTAPLAIGAAASTAVNVLNSKTSISHTGSLGGASGFMGIQIPYLIIHRANQCLPENFDSLKGYPSFIGSKFGTLSGYTEIEDIELEGLPFTKSELVDLRSILEGGVFL